MAASTHHGTASLKFPSLFPKVHLCHANLRGSPSFKHVRLFPYVWCSFAGGHFSLLFTFTESIPSSMDSIIGQIQESAESGSSRFSMEAKAHSPIVHIISICRFSRFEVQEKRQMEALDAAAIRAAMFLNHSHGAKCCRPIVETYLIKGLSSNANVATVSQKVLREIQERLEKIACEGNIERTVIIISSFDGFTTNMEAWLRFFSKYPDLELCIFSDESVFRFRMLDKLNTIKEMSFGIHKMSGVHEFVVRMVQCSLNKAMYVCYCEIKHYLFVVKMSYGHQMNSIIKHGA